MKFIIIIGIVYIFKNIIILELSESQRVWWLLYDIA